jgi:hypothetical protein
VVDMDTLTLECHQSYSNTGIYADLNFLFRLNAAAVILPAPIKTALHWLQARRPRDPAKPESRLHIPLFSNMHSSPARISICPLLGQRSLH